MIENFNGIFYLAIFLVILAMNTFYGYSCLFNTKNFMNKNATKTFILYYEKLTKWMMKDMPANADMLIKVDKDQKIRKIIY